MAPLPESSTLTTLLTSLLKRIPSVSPSPAPLLAPGSETQPHLSRRTEVPGAGVTPFNNIPNKAVFALFGLLGAAFVVTGIWFFFWARNGGFYFHENDWEEYKSTVLRRKGPNGTTLSGATASTDLGGGSIVHGEDNDEKSVWGRMTRKGRKKGGNKQKRYESYRDNDETTEYLGAGGASTIGDSEMSELKQEKRRSSKPAGGEKREKKSRFRRNRHAAPTTEATSEAETLTVADPDEEVDIGVQDAMRAYRHEKPARVGGLNKPAEGSSWDGSTEASSELMSHREPTPTNTPTKIRKERNDRYTGGNGGSGNVGGIRKVVSTSQPNSGTAAAASPSSNFWTRSSTAAAAAPQKSLTSSSHRAAAAEAAEAADRDRERERVRAEARKLQEKGRAATSSRRDFSFQHGDDNSTVISGTTATSSPSLEDAEREARREARRAERERVRRSGGASAGGSRSPTKRDVPGAYYEESEVGSSVVSGDTGTKSYHHTIPGLSPSNGGGADEYKEERRKRRAEREREGGAGGGGGGYRRGR